MITIVPIMKMITMKLLEMLNDNCFHQNKKIISGGAKTIDMHYTLKRQNVVRKTN